MGGAMNSGSGQNQWEGPEPVGGALLFVCFNGGRLKLLFSSVEPVPHSKDVAVHQEGVFPFHVLLFELSRNASLEMTAFHLSSAAAAVRVQRAGRGPAGPAAVPLLWQQLCRVLPGPGPLLLLGRPDLLRVVHPQQEVNDRGNVSAADEDIQGLTLSGAQISMTQFILCVCVCVRRARRQDVRYGDPWTQCPVTEAGEDFR